jgi:hypothetical protein
MSTPDKIVSDGITKGIPALFKGGVSIISFLLSLVIFLVVISLWLIFGRHGDANPSQVVESTPAHSAVVNVAKKSTHVEPLTEGQ